MTTVTGGGGPTRWRNWAGNQSVGDIHVLRPPGTTEVADVVAVASSTGRRVKVAGAGHSFSGIGRPSDLLVVLPAGGIRTYDAGSGEVTVDAGMTLHALSVQLARLGRALVNVGDIDVQTVGGAMATGTHGTGARFGGLATQVTAMEVVTADGRLVWSPGDAGPALWSVGRVHLGALGVVTAVRLGTVPLYALCAEEAPMPLDRVLDDWDELVDGADHFEAFWWPHTTTTTTKRNTRVDTSRLAPRPAWRSAFDDRVLANGGFGALVLVGRRVPRLVPLANRIAAGGTASRCYTDLSYRVFPSERRVRFYEMEYAVERAAAVGVFRALTSAVERSGLRIAFPVELRVAAADDIALSTAEGRDSAYVAVHVPAGVDHRRYFGLVADLMDDAGGRPHWGKLHRLDAVSLRERYPRFDEFVDLRRSVDPAGVFANAELDRVLGRP